MYGSLRGPAFALAVAVSLPAADSVNFSGIPLDTVPCTGGS